ncbi:MAG: NAD+ synthase [Candidatus Bipolaricaulota bacterium]|nr:NAD+ synthase [Candidatus Bipolaricaulota bacterium]MDW8126499.1 NAD+ synthase [Candidatus Bipolaricaulota bacterium]
MKLAIAQINPTVGDFPGNLRKIKNAIGQAVEKRADLVIFPELALLGYPPRDLLLRRGLKEKADEAFQIIVKESAKIPIVIGHITEAPAGPKNRDDPAAFHWQPHRLYNTVFLLHSGTILGYQAKFRLPSFDVFEEERYFLPGERVEIFDWQGLRVGLSVCEDLWYEMGVVATQAKAGVDLLINVSASPYFLGKASIRYRLGRRWAEAANAPVVYVNLVGGQDELIFDGRSFVIRPDGSFLLACAAFREGLFLVDLAGPPLEPPQEEGIEDVHQALVLGLRDYCLKNGLKKAVIGVSGGVDSAVVTALATMALGPENVIAAFLPGPYTAELSRECAYTVAQNLDVALLELSIEPALEALRKTISAAVPVEGVVAENLQARIRGTVLMALANATGAIVLCPGNKAEIAMGYNTLYGDTVGAIAPIGDLLKEDVYALARHINEEAGKAVIPEEVLTRPPSAELRPNQRDEDDIPPYALLDPALRLFCEKNAGYSELVEKFGEDMVKEILHRLYRAEYKRRQLPLVLKVSPKAFGLGWRFPVTNRFVG